MKPESESETFTLSSKFGAFSKPSEVRGLVIYSNVSPLVTPNFLSLSYYELPFLEGLGKCCFFFFLDDLVSIPHSHYIVPGDPAHSLCLSWL